MRSSALSDAGRSRPLNEDRVLVDVPLGLLVVADGMGGHAAGEVASALAVDTIAACLRAPSAPSEARDARLVAAITEADASIRARAEAHADLVEMGTTVVAALAGETDVCVAHVGDSRAYLLHGRELVQLTRDHTLVADMVAAGEITARQARAHRFRHYLNRSLGNRLGPLAVDVRYVPWSKGDRLLLCSDGLVRMLTDAPIRSTLVRAGDDLDRGCRDLVAAANRAGGQDNISVIVACPGPSAGATPR